MQNAFRFGIILRIVDSLQDRLCTEMRLSHYFQRRQHSHVNNVTRTPYNVILYVSPQS